MSLRSIALNLFSGDLIPQQEVKSFYIFCIYVLFFVARMAHLIQLPVARSDRCRLSTLPNRQPCPFH
jgi:hypothetical protein